MNIEKSFFSFFRFYVLDNNKITVIARKLTFFRKYRYFNSLSNATHPIQIHKAVREKLRFEKKSEKNLNLKYIWNLWINPFAQRTISIGVRNLPLQKISKRLSQFNSMQLQKKKKSLFFINYFFSSKNNE